MGKHLSRLYSAELEGISANIIDVEADINAGLHKFNIVGLADKAVNEAKERVNSALKNSGIKPPNRENRKITINLAPAHIKKAGSHYDLAIALAYLLATDQMGQFFCEDKLFLGELALNGELRPVLGALNIAEAASRSGFKYLFVPEENAEEAVMAAGIKIIPVKHLKQTIEHIADIGKISPPVFKNLGSRARRLPQNNFPDLGAIKGQAQAKRAMMIAAAGKHNVLLTGPPGVGKSLLAHAFVGIMPDLTREEQVDVMKIWSVAGLSSERGYADRPFRAPHHSASLRSFIGGGQDPRPGEISLAHCGALFMDEFPEFQKDVLEALREPMESGYIHIARAKKTLSFPARFVLIAAMNPCACGYFGDPQKPCKCAAFEVFRYQRRISGPLIDRIDIQVKLGRIAPDVLREKTGPRNESPRTREAVLTALAFSGNRRDPAKSSEEISLDPSGESFLGSLKGSELSARAYFKLLGVARTIADLEQKEKVSEDHLAEAFSYRLRVEDA